MPRKRTSLEVKPTKRRKVRSTGAYLNDWYGPGWDNPRGPTTVDIRRDPILRGAPAADENPLDYDPTEKYSVMGALFSPEQRKRIRNAPRPELPEPTAMDYARSVGNSLSEAGMQALVGLAATSPAGMAATAPSVVPVLFDQGRNALSDMQMPDLRKVPSAVAGAGGRLADYVRQDTANALADVTPVGAARDYLTGLARSAQLRAQGRETAAADIEKMALPMLALGLVPGGEGRAAKIVGREGEEALANLAVREGEDALSAGGRRIAGAPQDVFTAADEAARREQYRQTVEKGAQGALWYDDSGRAIMSHVGEDPGSARKVAGAFSVTSAGTGVKPNTGFAIKGHNQAISGDPVVTGRFPKAMGANIEDIYSSSGAATGLKRGPFEQQLAIGGGFAEPGTDPRAVHDIWDGRAWGYTNPNGTPFSGSFSPAQHRWQDEQLQQVIPTLSNQPFDWTTGRVQGAGWTGEKINAGEISPEEAAYSYANDFPRHYAQGSRETVPGSNTGIMPGLLTADMAARQEFDNRISEILYDNAQRDRIALGFGALTGPSFKGPGVYEGINPGTQVQYGVGVNTVKKGMETPDLPVGKAIEPSSLNLMRAIEGTYGMLTGQKGVAGNKFFTGVPRSSQNAGTLNLGRPITNEEAERLLALQSDMALDPSAMGIIPSPTGVLVPDFGVGPKDLQTFLTRGGGELGAGKPEGGFFHGIYAENPWETPEGRYGQSYLDLIGERPAYVESFNRVAPELAEKLRREYGSFARERGYEIPTYFDEMLGAIAGGGESELRKLIRRRIGKAEGGLVENDMVAALLPMAQKYGLA